MKQFRFSSFSMNLWLAVVTVLMSVNLFFVITLIQMAPKASVLAQLFMDTQEVAQFKQLLDATSFDSVVADKKLIEEMLVRFYMEQRHEFIPDTSEMAYRWGRGGPIQRLSSPAVYQDFLKEQGDFKEKTQKGEKSGAVQSVTVRNVQRLQGNIFVVDFDLYTSDISGSPRPKRRLATMTIGENASLRRFSADFVNPFGTFVKQYTETDGNSFKKNK